MKKKRYIVEAKCGHVGRNNYIIKAFATKAESPSEAAAKARGFGRVKHHWKDAIVSVREVTEEEYLAQIDVNDNDPYFAAKSIQEQRATCEALEIVTSNIPDERPTTRSEIRGFHFKKDRESKREAFRMIREYQRMPAYAF